MRTWTSFTLTLLLGLFASVGTQAADVVNVYSSRHYYSDEKIYQAFTQATGIKVNVIEGKADELLARIKREGRLSPADVFISVDAGRLQLAVDAKVLAPIRSKVVDDRIPASLRHPEGLWVGLSQRLRCIFVAKDAPDDLIRTYADLADPKLKGKVLIRSSSNIYNQSLVASRYKILGEKKAQSWANGVVKNMARKPQGGDTDQLRALAAGEGQVAVANHYYFARMIAGDKKADNEAAKKIRIIFPDQAGRGVHVNVSGIGVLKTAKNKANAIKLIEFLTTKQAQKLWALDNHEFPAIQDLERTPILEAFGEFKTDSLNAAELGKNNKAAVRVMDRANWR